MPVLFRSPASACTCPAPHPARRCLRSAHAASLPRTTPCLPPSQLPLPFVPAPPPVSLQPAAAPATTAQSSTTVPTLAAVATSAPQPESAPAESWTALPPVRGLRARQGSACLAAASHARPPILSGTTGTPCQAAAPAKQACASTIRSPCTPIRTMVGQATAPTAVSGATTCTLPRLTHHNPLTLRALRHAGAPARSAVERCCSACSTEFVRLFGVTLPCLAWSYDTTNNCLGYFAFNKYDGKPGKTLLVECGLSAARSPAHSHPFVPVQSKTTPTPLSLTAATSGLGWLW